MFWNELRIHKSSKFGLFVNEIKQSNFNLRLPGSYLVQSYLITTLTQRSVHPTAQFCLAKIQKMRSVMTASISQILEPSLQGLISSII